MAIRFVRRFFIPVVLGLFLLSGSAAYACELGGDAGGCVDFHLRKPRRPAVQTVKSTPVANLVSSTPQGDSPAAAIEMDDNWRMIAPNTSLWLKTAPLPGPHMLELWLDANKQPGISFAIYGSDQITYYWPEMRPVGRAAFNRAMAEHDLYWKGQSALPGAWYALVTNSSNVPISFKISYSNEAKNKKVCTSYWEWIGKDYVYWTACRYPDQ